MKEKITRRTTLKAIAASAVAGGAWLTNLAEPELIQAATTTASPTHGSKTSFGELKGSDLKAAVDTFLTSPNGAALSSQIKAFGHALTPDLANGGWFVVGGQRRLTVQIPYGPDAGLVAASGTDLGTPEQAGASRLEQLGPDLFKVTSFVAANGTVNRAHVFVADRAHKRLDIHDVATGQSRTVTHADVQRMAQALQTQQTAQVLGGLVGAEVVSADACGWCAWLIGSLAAIGFCGGAAWLACFVIVWDPPVAAACAAIVGVFGGWILSFICYLLSIGFSAAYACYEIGYCRCPYPWGC
jgi:hypothetical protein